MSIRGRLSRIEQYLFDETPDPERSAAKARIVDVLMDRGIARKTAEEWCNPANNGLGEILREVYSEMTGTDLARRLANIAMAAVTTTSMSTRPSSL